MGVIDLAGIEKPQYVVVCVFVVFAMACATATPTVEWPENNVIETGPPEQSDGAPELVRGEDGMLYAVGAFDASPQAGEVVFGRYDGDWPLDEMPRPALFAGTVAEVYSSGVAHVHPIYEFPNVDPVGLAAEVFDDFGDETMGKGLGVIDEVDFSGPSELNLSIGSEVGVQRGDMYGVFKPFDSGAGAQAAQLTRRLLGICMVSEVDSEKSVCRLRQGHPSHQWAGTIEQGHRVAFLEPTFGNAPRPGRIMVAGGAEQEEVTSLLVEHFDAYMSRYPGGEVTVETIDIDADARDTEFYRWNRRLDSDDPAIFVGVTIEEIDGQDHLILNYTGLGVAVGPGMVAAPPENGVDMGRVDHLDAEALRGVSSLLMGTMMVFRGQTSEALIHLHDALRDPALSNKWRWHARDQYAMRWGALDRFEEAMWLVREDESIAEDDQALYNAIGTRVRLHDYLKQPYQAVELAERYLDARRDQKPSSSYMGALAMFSEMAVQADRIDDGKAGFQELKELCPDGCSGDILAMLAGIYWGAMEDSPELQDEIVATMVEVAQVDEETSLANARMFQGWNFLRDSELEQAVMAFLEARRLFEVEDSSYGMARAQFYISWMQIGLGNGQDGFDRGMQALDYMTELGDYRASVRIHERLSQLYADIEPSGRPSPYLGAGARVLRAGFQAQLATGDYGRSAEAAFSYGQFLFLTGNLDEARYSLQRSVWYGLRVAQFDTVAMSHILLAIVARAGGDMVQFEEELGYAQTMAELANEPDIDELIETIMSPPEEVDDPTQLL